MAHLHAGAYSASCETCQEFDRAVEWARCLEEQLDEQAARIAEITTVTPKTTRPVPASARVVRIHRRHDRGCECRDCRPFMLDALPFGLRVLVWLCQQVWWWTPTGQLIYWACVLAVLMSRS